jgi:hypothetical protein
LHLQNIFFNFIADHDSPLENYSTKCATWFALSGLC